ncbi:unnamed protein product, partial [Albugo candida]
DPTSVKRYEERVVQRTTKSIQSLLYILRVLRFRVEHFSRYGIKDKEEATVMDEGSDQTREDSPKYCAKIILWLPLSAFHKSESDLPFPR